MTKSLIQFKQNIDGINVVDGIYVYIENNIQALDASEILRSQFVLIVSAFDYYIHDAIRDGMLQIFDGKKRGNRNYDAFSISLKSVNLILSTKDKKLRRQLLDNEIRKITSKHSYQAPNNVERAFALISIKSIWTSVGTILKMPKEDIVKELGLIVNRRNKIAHEADIDPITTTKTPIDRKTIIDVRDFIVKLVYAIDKKL